MIKQGNTASAVQMSQTEIPSSLLIHWEQIKSLLQKEFGTAAFKSWIAPIVPQSFDNGVLELSVATRFMGAKFWCYFSC